MTSYFKGFSSLAVALCLTVVMVSGCGASETKQQGADTKVSTTAQAAGSTQSTGMDMGKKPTLKFVTSAGKLNDEPGKGTAYEVLVAKTGYQLEISVIPTEQYEAKLNMIMASNDEYDIIKQPTAAQFTNFVKNGAVAALDTSIEKYGSELNKYFDSKVWNEMKVGQDKIYGIPGTAMPRLWDGLAIRSDWLAKLGLNVPSTLDELYTVLKAFKEKDPGGLGKDSVIPFTTVYTGGALLDPISSAFGIDYEWVERDGKLVNKVELPEFKDYVLYMKKLYDEGLMDKDIIVNKDNTVMEKVNKGLVGAARYAWNQMYQTTDLFAKEHPDWKMSFVKNPSGAKGQQGMGHEAGISVLSFVPASSKNVDYAVDFVNQYMKNYENLTIGDEGVDWKMDGENRVPILPAFNNDRGDMFFYQPAIAGEVEYPLWLVRVFKLPSMGNAYNELKKANEDIIKENPVSSTLSLPTVNQNSAAVTKDFNDAILKFIIGEDDMSKWDSAVNKWKTDGGDAMTTEVNSWYSNNK